MAKNAAALHILVKEEKQALDLLEQLKTAAISRSWPRSIQSARRAKKAVIWVNSVRARWFLRSIKWCSPARC